MAPTYYGRLDLDPDDKKNRYLNAVRYQDFVLRELMAQYEELGLAEDTVFLILGDHGEAFWEHGRRAHDEVIYEEGMRVPALLYEPGSGLQPGTLPGSFSQLDIVPTAIDRLGLEIQEGDYAGRSFLAPATPRSIHGSCYAARKCIAQWRGDQKYIHFFGLRPDALYDLGRDPGERKNLAPERGQDVARLREEGLSWRKTLWALYQGALDSYVSSRAPDVEFPVHVRFGDSVELLGYSVDRPYVEPGGSITFTYHFKVLSPLPEGYHLFIHAYDGDKRRVWKHFPVKKLYPEENWKTGDFISDPHQKELGSLWRGERLKIRMGFEHPSMPNLPTEPPADGDAPWVVDLEVRHPKPPSAEPGSDRRNPEILEQDVSAP
jgi:lipoteichoic acid synthase